MVLSKPGHLFTGMLGAGSLVGFVAAVALGAVLAACSPTVSAADVDASPGGGQPDGAPIGSTCTGTALTCSGSNVTQCQGGQIVDVTTCTSPQVCAPGVELRVACDPQTENGLACMGTDVYQCNTDGTFGSMVSACGTNGCSFGVCGGSPTSDCDTGSASQIYVVATTINPNTGSSTDQFLSFSPTNGNAFTPIGGNLSCPAGAPFPSQDPGDGVSHPYSMSVDREGRAWVLYSSGEIMWVKLADGTCSKSGWVSGGAGYQLFGMGFTATSAGSSDERLYDRRRRRRRATPIRTARWAGSIRRTTRRPWSAR